jgi:hypothetical protein
MFVLQRKRCAESYVKFSECDRRDELDGTLIPTPRNLCVLCASAVYMLFRLLLPGGAEHAEITQSSLAAKKRKDLPEFRSIK